MNKKGQTFGVAIISMVVIFIIGMMCINFVMTEVTNARTDLSCSSASTISDSTKLLCLVIDTTVPYWIWLIISISIGAIIVRMYL